MSPYPLRTLVEWRTEPTPLGPNYIAYFSCGHRENFGRGPQPTFTQWPCGQCPKAKA